MKPRVCRVIPNPCPSVFHPWPDFGCGKRPRCDFLLPGTSVLIASRTLPARERTRGLHFLAAVGVAHDRQVRQELLDFGRPHEVGAADTMKADKAICSVNTSFRGSIREMLDPGHLANLFKEFHEDSPSGFCAPKRVLDGRSAWCSQHTLRPSNPFSSAQVIFPIVQCRKGFGLTVNSARGTMRTVSV